MYLGVPTSFLLSFGSMFRLLFKQPLSNFFLGVTLISSSLFTTNFLLCFAFLSDFLGVFLRIMCPKSHRKLCIYREKSSNYLLGETPVHTRLFGQKLPQPLSTLATCVKGLSSEYGPIIIKPCSTIGP